MGRLRNTLAVAAIGAALSAPAAAAEEAPPAPPSEAPAQGHGLAEPAPPLQQGDTLEAPAPTPPNESESSGGTSAKPKSPPQQETNPTAPAEPEAGAIPAPTETFEIPSIPSSSCATSGGVPPILIPIYQRAADAYGLGPQGAAVLASINGIESAFGTNMGPSSAGAIGWMQFLPSTWESWGVDANGDGVRDPYNPEDAIFAAAAYLNASGMPADTYGAIFSYNHADWYVAEVLANAACYGSLVGGPGGGFALVPQLQTLSCTAAPKWRDEIPDEYMEAFEAAASRYELGQRGVWALAAVARLESNFGRGMGKRQLQKHGPLGLDGSEWSAYAVDGDEDGRIQRTSPADSAATLARLIWSRGSLRAGIFTHNQAEWYVQAVLGDAERLEGGCQTHPIDWSFALPGSVGAPINWSNLTLSNDLELHDITSGALDPRIIGLIGAITQDHQITISALRSDHSEYTSEGNVSNHYFGRAMDIAAVDGVSCTDTAVDAPCAELGRTLAYLPAPAHPTELIYCFDLDGPGPAFARSDHCDHVHAGYDG
jgi:membrane-bound lytic murein transglycosylase B